MIGVVATLKVQEGKGAEFEAVFIEQPAQEPVVENRALNELGPLRRLIGETATEVVQHDNLVPGLDEMTGDV